jgi:transcription-repair coupling factor (superfamily II helicase)
LAQLYQLRGRVGRGAARAYSYFFRHNKLRPTAEGQQRLEVIAENTQLGAGYSIAMRDLEIRGAGELLGTRQHGHIQAVGFHLYTRLLADAVRQIRRIEVSKKNGEVKDEPFDFTQGKRRKIDVALSSLTQPISMPVNVDLPLAVGIPASYIADQDLRLRLYRRIADLRDETEIDALTSAISWESGQIVLRYPPLSEDKDGRHLPDLGPGIRGGRNAYWCSFGRDEDWQEKLLEVLGRLNEK